MIETNDWQRVPGTESVEIYPIIPRANCVSSSCFILSAPGALVVVDPGASAEQTREINRILVDALALAPRPVLVFLTHCHQDHSQEAGALELPPGTRVARFAHQVGVEALARRDRSLTVAYLYPWHPEVCAAPFDGILFAADPSSASEPAVAGFVPCPEPIVMHEGAILQHEWIGLGGDARLHVYHTPGHSPCSVSLRVGSLLMLGDLPFAANPGVCGLDGWSRRDLLQTLRKLSWLLDSGAITECCPGHGRCVPAPRMRQKLRLMEVEAASSLTDVPRMDAERVGALKHHVDELLEETAALLTTFSGRLYTVSYYLSLLEEEGAAGRVLAALDVDGIDRLLSDFHRMADAFKTSPMPEWSLVLKGVQVAQSVQAVLTAEPVPQLLDTSLVERAERRIADFLGIVHGLQFLQTERPGAVDTTIAALLERAAGSPGTTTADLMDAAGDDQSFVRALTARMAAHSPLHGIQLEFAPGTGDITADIGARRLDDILTSLMESMAGQGVKHIRIATRMAAGHLEIQLSSRDRMDSAAFAGRRLALYDRTLGWLGGSLRCMEHDGHATFVVRLPVLEVPIR